MQHFALTATPDDDISESRINKSISATDGGRDVPDAPLSPTIDDIRGPESVPDSRATPLILEELRYFAERAYTCDETPRPRELDEQAILPSRCFVPESPTDLIACEIGVLEASEELVPLDPRTVYLSPAHSSTGVLPNPLSPSQLYVRISGFLTAGFFATVLVMSFILALRGLQADVWWERAALLAPFVLVVRYSSRAWSWVVASTHVLAPGQMPYSLRGSWLSRLLDGISSILGRQGSD